MSFRSVSTSRSGRRGPARSVLSRVTAVAMVPALTVGWVTVGTAPAAAAEISGQQAKDVRDTPFSAQELGTVQIDGVVWDQAIVGDTVYVGGDFSSARPAGAAPGERETPRANLLAYNIRTGEMIGSWAPSVNGQVKSIKASKDGKSLYIGGSFTQLNGRTVSRMAKISAADGSQDTRFRSNPVATVNDIAVAADGTVYYGGVFGQVGTQTRNRVAAVDGATGALKPFAPNLQGGAVWGLDVDETGENLYVGGAFTSANGSSNPGNGMARFRTSDGALMPFSANQVVRNGGTSSAITSMRYKDGQVYGTGYWRGGAGRLEGTFNANADGSLKWINDCHGDSYDSVAQGGSVFSVNHSHDCRTLGEFPENRPYRYTTATTEEVTGKLGRSAGYYNFEGNPAPSMQSWEPTFIGGEVTGAGQAGWTVDSNGEYLIYGGEFTKVNGRPQQGLVRFPAKKLSDKYPPHLRGDSLALTATANDRGGINLTWKGSWDRDSRRLTYKLIRNGDTANPVDVTDADSTSWFIPSFSHHDTTAEGKNTYKVIVSDPQGNTVTSNEVTATSKGLPGNPTSAYSRAVVTDGPTDYWRLGGDPALRRSTNQMRDNNLNYHATVKTGQPGALVGDPDRAVNYSNRPTSGLGGSWSARIQDAPQTFSTEAWFRTTSTAGGQITGFGNTTAGKSVYHDRKLMMDTDGTLVAGVNPGTPSRLVSPKSYNDGQWHHAVTTLSRDGYSLYVDGVRVAHDADTTQAAPNRRGYWRVGGDTTAGWGLKTENPWFNGDIDEVAIYGKALSPESVAAHYEAGSGKAPAAGGDQQEPAESPTAQLSTETTDLTVRVDGRASKAAQGEISSYEWDFGDGATADGPTAQHTYAKPGSYEVSLKVTDERGATATSTETVTVQAPAGEPQAKVLVEDNFSRDVDGGLGSADTGGAWQVRYRDAQLSVKDGNLNATFTKAGVSSAAFLIPEQTSTDLNATVSLDKVPNNGGAYITVQGRRVGSDDYRTTARVLGDGRVVLSLQKKVGNQVTTLSSRTISGLTLKNSERMNIRMVADGTSPTQLKAKVWKAGAGEPADWQLSTTDATASLQKGGSVGYDVYLASSVTNLPVTFMMDSFTAATYEGGR